MIIRVDHDRCTGHARCNAFDSQVFELDDVGYSSIGTVEIPAGHEELAQKAIANCPEMAITLEN